MSTGLLRTDLGQRRQWRFAKRPTRGGQQDSPHTDLGQATRIVTWQTLENRIVLAVDGQQHGATALHRLHEQRTGHHQGFLVGQQDLLAGLNRRQSRTQARRPHNGRHHRIDLGRRSDLAQPGFAFEHFGGRSGRRQAFAQLLRRLGARHHGKGRRMAQAKRKQFLEPRIAAQRKHLVAVGMTPDDIQGAHANGASSSQHGNTLHAAHITPQLAAQSSTANSGMAAVRLSIRSSTPP
ncbi:hypothetical protein D3C77_363880 [compost metagenome]